MAYRDDLEAAHARIEALEQQLAFTGEETADAQALLARSKALEAQIVEMQERVRALVAEHQRLLEMVRSSSNLPTLTDHNRTVPPGKHAKSGTPGGVLCPLCAVAGHNVEMHVGGNLQLVVDLEGIGAVRNTARCPRCSYLALKSDGPRGIDK